MDSVKQIELQQQIKENSTGYANTISELHKWEQKIKRTSAANCQTKKNEVSFFLYEIFCGFAFIFCTYQCQLNFIK